jgi:hypothetical protein
MSWWQRFRHGPTPFPKGFRAFNFTMEGWSEDAPSGDLRVWRSSQGDVLSWTTSGSLDLPSLGDTVRLQHWCRGVAEGRGAGLIEARVNTGGLGATVSFIYKRLQMPAYVFTGMLVIPSDEMSIVWTVVSGERGTTGVREAVVTAQLMSAGRLTIEDYKRSWAQDPYEPAYRGVDRKVLRFVSDNEAYDEQFPEHPLSKVRRVLANLPSSVRFDSGTPEG